MEEYKPNSYKAKAEAKAEKAVREKVEPVISGNARLKKKGLGSKFAGVFRPEDAKSVKEYAVVDVAIPAIKKALYDIVSNGFHMFLYGTKGDPGARRIGVDKISYRSYYDRKDEPRLSREIKPRGVYDYDEVIFDNREEAEAVLDGLYDLIGRYKLARVADLYDLANISHNPTDNGYGWTDLTDAKVVHTMGGFKLAMPKVMPIDD